MAFGDFWCAAICAAGEHYRVIVLAAYATGKTARERDLPENIAGSEP
jgi:hypothetical protein